jgi:hypothetical protein
MLPTRQEAENETLEGGVFTGEVCAGLVQVKFV